MGRFLGFLFALVLLAVLLLDRAASDVAPSPMTGGWPVRPYEDGATDVRMVEEDVVVQIYTDSIVTVGSFSMHNEGETVSMEVGFPFYYPDDLIHFRAFVDGRPVEVRDGQKYHSDPRSRKSWTVYWKLWDTTFHRGQTCAIRVEYKTKPRLPPGPFSWRKRHASLPVDVHEALRQATTIETAEYTLDTGKGWKGVLDRCRVSFELVGMSDAHIQRYWPEDGVVTEDCVVWEYIDYEPSRRAVLTYCPYMPVREIPEVLRSIVERFPNDPPLASQTGSFCANYLGRKDLLREIYHSFLARWHEPIPQLMEYAPSGRCRFNYEAGNHFFTVWRMASVLFDRYRDIGELEQGRDIAPTVSRISGAIVDSLNTCGGLPTSNEALYREAKELLDLSNRLIEGRQ